MHSISSNPKSFAGNGFGVGGRHDPATGLRFGATLHAAEAARGSCGSSPREASAGTGGRAVGIVSLRTLHEVPAGTDLRRSIVPAGGSRQAPVYVACGRLPLPAAPEPLPCPVRPLAAPPPFYAAAWRGAAPAG